MDRLPPHGHDPVLLDGVLATLQPGPAQVVVDCTLGRAGHARQIAEHLGAEGLLIGMDVDQKNLEFSHTRLADLPCKSRLFHANFTELDQVLGEIGIAHVDAILADLGVSTNQLFDSQYGLSFAAPMPLDMRLDWREKKSAVDLVNNLSETDLADVLYKLADERYSRRISRKIVEARRLSPITTTDRLADLVRAAFPARHANSQRIDPATRTFMALRMAVNHEVENLGVLLEQAPGFLKPGGRLAVISFHSVEDRLVKQAFRSAEQTGLLKVLTKRPLSASDDEIAANPRSRSAKLRAAIRVV